MNRENIPEILHCLIPITEEWGIGDDGYRDVKIEGSTNAELTKLVSYFSDEVIESLNSYLEKPNPVEPQTDEYYKYTSLFMAFEYATAELNNRKINNC